MTLQVNLRGDDGSGWIWSVIVDDVLRFETKPLEREDLALSPFAIQRDADRVNHAFDSVGDEMAYQLLYGYFVSGELHDLLDGIALNQTWDKHRASPRVPQTVAGHLFLIDGVRKRLLCGTDRLTAVVHTGVDFDAQLLKCRQSLEHH
jgi:hypothetical protein